MNEQENEQEEGVNPLTTGVGLGIAVGVCFRLVMNNLALGVATVVAQKKKQQ